MDSVLYKIIEIERAAQNISDEAVRARRNMPKEIEAERERLLTQIKEQIDKQIEKFAEEEAKDEQNRIEQIELRHKQQMELLRENFSSNSAIWEKEIYEKVRKK